jgi:predicted metal-dependent phosphoesterase TrpH
MADAMEELGWVVDRRVLAGRAAPGRPHLARAVAEAPENAARLREEGLVSPGALLEAYLLPGQAGFRPRTRPSVAEAVEAIHAAGGVAVWAHPFWDVDEPAVVEAALRRFAALGMDGVEAFYPTHGPEHARLLDRVAREHGLLTTGSSDFHGPDHGTFGRFLAFALHGLEPRLGPIGRAP